MLAVVRAHDSLCGLHLDFEMLRVELAVELEEPAIDAIMSACSMLLLEDTWTGENAEVVKRLLLYSDGKLRRPGFEVFMKLDTGNDQVADRVADLVASLTAGGCQVNMLPLCAWACNVSHGLVHAAPDLVRVVEVET